MSDNQVIKLDEIEVGDFIKFVDKDDQGKFSYVGEVIKVTNKKKQYFEMLTFEGIMHFKWKESMTEEFYKTTTKPTGWAKFKNGSVAPVAFEKKKIAKVKTKKEQIFELVKNNPKKKENALVNLAKKEIGGSEDQLRTIIKLALIKIN